MGIWRSFNNYFNVFQLQYFHRMYSRLEKRIREKKKSVQKRMKRFSRRKIIWSCRCFERRPSSRRPRSPTRTGRAIEDGAPSSAPRGQFYGGGIIGQNPTDLIQILSENKTLRDGHVDTRLGILTTSPMPSSPLPSSPALLASSLILAFTADACW